MPEDPPYKIPFVCFECRKCFKRQYDTSTSVRPCPHCKGNAIRMDIRFRVPKSSDNDEWKKIIFLAQHGFYFQKIYRLSESGGYQRVSYPSTLSEAKNFVKKYRSQALEKRI
jgi:hypothetical protein